jgi:hypothetical protein
MMCANHFRFFPLTESWKLSVHCEYIFNPVLWLLFKRLLQTFAMHFDLQLPEMLDTFSGYWLDTQFQSEEVSLLLSISTA